MNWKKIMSMRQYSGKRDAYIERRRMIGKTEKEINLSF
jgi:hypothetical protein